jgi:hypothetical protein
MDRAAPRPYLPSINGGPATRRHFGMDGEWGRVYFNPQAPPRPGDRAWEDFRDKFRLPLPMFNWVLRCAREDGRFPFDPPPNGGHDPTPMCLKVAAFFRWLAVGAQVNAYCEGSGCSRQTLQAFFPDFGNWLVERFFAEWIKIPTNVEQVAALAKPFQMLGIPGAICSQDGVHVPWNRCPSALRADYTGKEGYPTLVWNCCLAHTTRILCVHGHRRTDTQPWIGAFKGACNDKTVVRTDPFISAIGSNDIFVDFNHSVIVNDQFDTMNMRGAFAINDGGYHNWIHTIAGTKDGQSASTDEGRWSSTMESIRKDSERSFGIMKKRFRILQIQSYLHTSTSIDTVFKVMPFLYVCM